MNVQQIFEYGGVCLVIIGMVVLLAIQRIDTTTAVGTLTLAMGYLFGAIKSTAVINAQATAQKKL